VSSPWPEPGPGTDTAALLLDYLDTYRATVARKVADLSSAQLRSTPLPSGWSPIEMVSHLVQMERRWLVWGFSAEDVKDPWGDQQDGRWHVDGTTSVEELLEQMAAGGARTRSIVEAAGLDAPATTGGRFPAGDTPPSLVSILVHVLQEYARHTGHLDAARELLDGSVGE
jgi:uncharacterized damage-inducible protein DinB